MNNLFEGVLAFNGCDFKENRELFESIGRKQTPHTLFIGCSDSRIVPNLITKTMPGELFVIRNIANLIPPYRETDEYVSTTSAIEYAVQVLNVTNIVVCGHSNCGGCRLLLSDEDIKKTVPHTSRWMDLATNVKNKIVEAHIEDPIAREQATEQLNIVEQLSHLMTYPYIKERVESCTLNLLGWYYQIDTGDIYNYDIEKGQFVRIE
ncbi:MAG: carbonic anhydrase [Clostridiales bacterium]|nr:carbonic anhydrase [Clostridiales bacterium]